MKNECKSLAARLREHCNLAGINPPKRALMRYATLRYIDGCWWLANKMDDDRRELLEELFYRLKLANPPQGTPICSADLPRGFPRSPLLAEWPDAPLIIGLEDFV